MINSTRFKKGEHRSPKTEFKTGQRAWNKRTKGIMKPNSGSFKKGQVAPMKGKQRPDMVGNKFREGISSWNRGMKIPNKSKGIKRPHTSGENNNMWKGGISGENKKLRYSIEWKRWRETIYNRDDFTCQGCQKKGICLNPHHIRKFSDYPVIRFDVDNGITLCNECHDNTKGREKEFVELFDNWIIEGGDY